MQLILKCPFRDCAAKLITQTELQKTVKFVDPFKTIQLGDSTQERSTSIPTEFLIIHDVWDFDNIGVSRIMEGTGDLEYLDLRIASDQILNKQERLLICGECDRGPLGAVCQVKGGKPVYLLSLGSVEKIGL